MKWIKADKDNFPKGKCLAIFLEPAFGHFSLEIRTAYYDIQVIMKIMRGKDG